METSQGRLRLPQYGRDLALHGRQSKIIFTNYAFGTSRVLYSTAQVLFAGRIGERDVLFLHGDARQEHEVSLELLGVPTPVMEIASHPGVVHHRSRPGQNRIAGQTGISFLAGIEGLVTVWDSDEQLVLFSDSETAGRFWAPSVADAGSGAPFANFWSFGTNTSVLVGGPYLVREARMQGRELALSGDLDEGVRLIVIASPDVTSITWNDIPVPTVQAAAGGVSAVGAFAGELALRGGYAPVEAQPLEKWRFAWSLPEIWGNFSDADWTVADKKSTNIPYKPLYGDGTVLYGCDYGL